MVIAGINRVTEQATRILSNIDGAAINSSIQLFAAFGAFAQGAVGVCAIANTIFGIAAQQHIAKASKEMAEQLKSIAGSLQEMNDAAQANLNIIYQTNFAQHVYDCTAMVTVRDKTPGVPHYVFVYHPGNDWHPAFERLWRERPIEGCCGLTDNINLLLAWLPAFRKTVTTKARITILMPSAHVYVLTDTLTIDPSIGEFHMVGETHHTGTPYTYLSIAENLHGLRPSRIGAMLMVKEKPRSFGHQLAKWTTTPLAGMSAGLAGSTAGFVVSTFVIASLPINAPIIFFPAAFVAFVGPTIGGGAAAGVGAGIGVRQAWDRKEEQNRERLRAEKIQSLPPLDKHVHVKIS
jgi:hypothetical protein